MEFNKYNKAYALLMENKNKMNGFVCTKQSVNVIIINKDNNYVLGSNNINNYVEICPRVKENYPTGQGYHLCKEICNQNNHAEQDAIAKAKELGIDIEGADLYLIGHTYFCDACTEAMKNAKIATATILTLSNTDVLDFNTVQIH